MGGSKRQSERNKKKETEIQELKNWLAEYNNNLFITFKAERVASEKKLKEDIQIMLDKQTATIVLGLKDSINKNTVVGKALLANEDLDFDPYAGEPSFHELELAKIVKEYS